MVLHTQTRSARPSAATTTTDWSDDYGDVAGQDERIVQGIRWARTGLLNAKGQPILKRLDKPIGFFANHDEPVYAIEDLD